MAKRKTRPRIIGLVRGNYCPYCDWKVKETVFASPIHMVKHFYTERTCIKLEQKEVEGKI